MKFGTCYCTHSSDVFQTKMRKRKEERKKYNWKKEKKWKREMRRWETVRMTEMLRHRRATVLAADAVSGRSKICRKGGESISELTGCSSTACQLWRKQKKRNKKVNLSEQELQS